MEGPASTVVGMSEPSPQTTLAAALRERIAIISDRAFYQRDPAGHLASLTRVSEQIAEFQGRLPQPIDPQLAHYLQRCSYDKALAFLEGSSAAQ